jgi:hypothetical protein
MMAVSVGSTVRVKLGTSETTIIDTLGTGVVKRVALSIRNVGPAKAVFEIHQYQSGSESADTSAGTTGRWFGRELGPNCEEVIEDSFFMQAGWKLSGLADIADDVIIFCDVLDD